MEDSILALLEAQIENFPIIKGFMAEKGLNSTTLFLPQTIKGIAEEITHRNDLMIECITYYDLVKIYSLATYDDPERFTETIIHIVTSNRVVDSANLIINKTAVDDFLFSSKEETEKFLNSNKFLISLYIFSMINKMFYKQP